MTVTFEDVAAAAVRIEGVARRTPIHTSSTLDDRLGAKQVFLKCENFQRAGAFKFRGAYNTLAQLSDEERTQGVLTYSSGNHAQALSLAGRILGVEVTVVMPSDAPTVKREATEGYGGKIVLYERDETSREALGAEIAKEKGLTIVPPYDDPRIVAGQGTTAWELVQEAGFLDLLLVPCGGGGLLSGCGVVMKNLQPGCRVIGIEPDKADDAARSFESGRLQTVTNPDTIADGARTPSLGRVTFPLVRKYVDSFATVTDDEILDATWFLWERTKLVVEPTGALGVAALLAGKVDVAGRRVGVVLSGGNADFPALLRAWEARKPVRH